MAANNSQYWTRWYETRRRFWIYYLGGACLRCGTTENLQFDHIDPSTKIASITRALAWPLQRLKAEVDKCQLLCRKCHIAKSKADIPMPSHGTLSRYCNQKCRCHDCRGALRRYSYARYHKIRALKKLSLNVT